MPRIKKFNVKKHDFHFRNHFKNNIGPITTDGLCGGMALAVHDYFKYNLPIPTHTDSNLPHYNYNIGSHNNYKLFSYIYKR